MKYIIITLCIITAVIIGISTGVHQVQQEKIKQQDQQKQIQQRKNEQEKNKKFYLHEVTSMIQSPCIVGQHNMKSIEVNESTKKTEYPELSISQDHYNNMLYVQYSLFNLSALYFFSDKGFCNHHTIIIHFKNQQNRDYFWNKTIKFILAEGLSEISSYQNEISKTISYINYQILDLVYALTFINDDMYSIHFSVSEKDSLEKI